MNEFVYNPDLLLLGLSLLVIILLLTLTGITIANSRRRSEEASARSETTRSIEAEIAALKGSLNTLAEVTVTRQSEVSRNLHERLDTVSQNLGQNLTENSKKTTDSLAQLQERLAVIDTAQQNITDLSSKVVSLQDVLSNKQSRGAFGQGRMENIIQDALPRNSYTFQATLSNGKRPDCLIHLPNDGAAIAIDAKFPLEGFEAFRAAQNDADRKEAARQVRTHVGRHIEDIAAKYFISGETQDSAIMFIPSESIYADLNEFFPDLVQKAYRSRIIISAPNMLMLAVQTIQSIMKDVQMREAAGLIKQEVSYLMEDMQRLRERVLNLQKHFGQANKDMEQISTSSEKILSRGTRIEALDFNESKPEPEKVKETGTLLAGE